MAIPIERLDEYRWRIPAGTNPGMHVPAITLILKHTVANAATFRITGG